MTISTNQVTVTTSPTQIVPVWGRSGITITNTTTTPVYIGDATVSVTTGQLIPGVVGASETVPHSAAIYGIVATGSAVVTYLETA